MKINETIRAKAKAIIKEREDKEKYIDTCISANICPVCGEKLIIKQPEDEYIYQITECSIDSFHYEKKEYHDIDEYD